MATTTATAVQLQPASQQQANNNNISNNINNNINNINSLGANQQTAIQTNNNNNNSATNNILQQQPTHKVVDDQQLSLNIRLLMQGKEVGSIIGKKGDNIKRFREESGAKINISDGSVPERIVTLTGSAHEVFKAFSMICRKFEEGLQQQTNNNNIIGNNNNNSILVSNNSSVTATITTATTQQQLVGQQHHTNSGLLSNIASSQQSHTTGIITSSNNNNINNSTTIISNNNHPTTLITTNGTTINNNNINSINNNNNNNNNKPLVTLRLIIPASQCGSLIGRGGAKIKEIREITGATIQVASEMLPGSTERAVTIAGNVESLTKCAYQICSIMVESPPKGYTIPYRPKSVMTHIFTAASAGQAAAAAAAYQIPGQYTLQPHPEVNRVFVANNPLAVAFNPAAANLRAAAAANATTGQAAALTAAAAVATSQALSTTEMIIPNGLIGCVIGKGGSKINEIRQLSGATIKISNSEEGTKNRNVTINGTPEAINLAQYLITASATGGQASLYAENGAKAAIANKTARKFAPY